MQKNRKNIIIIVFLSLLVFYFALKDDFNLVMQQVCKTELIFLLIACVFLVLNWLVRAKMMQMMIKKFKKDYKYKYAIRLVVLTNLFNAITPFGTGGEPAQVYLINKDGVDVPSATTVVLQKLIVFQLTLLIFGITSIIINHFTHIFTQVIFIRNLVIVGFILNSVLLIFTFLLSFNKHMKKKLSKFLLNIIFFRKNEEEKNMKLSEWNTYLDNFHESAIELRKNKLDLLKIMLLSVLEVSLFYIVPFFLMRGIAGYYPTGIVQTLIASNYVILSTGFIPIPGASGGREFSFISFFGAFLKGPALTALMLVWRFITYYLLIFIGAIVMMFYNKKEKAQ